MAHWLLKTEPGTYSYDTLEKDGKTVWDGVSNNLALQYIRQMKKGDLAFIYHSGEEKQIVGIAEITSNAYPDPKLKDGKLVVFNLKPKSKVKRPVTLAEIKADASFADFHLVRMSRLSVMPVTPAQWEKISAMAK
ncbi:MAG TPA: EVE domain-containing protein [Candidatus Kapabacteria bacterium]|nr:EVE domain-containing protein [Candidatus Kapabacteria bacterium]